MVATSEPTTMAYRFKETAHIPKGVTVDGILEERTRIICMKGIASARAAADAILENEDAFPNLRAFGPDTPEDAYRQGMEHGVRRAFASIVIVPVQESKGTAREVRLLYAIPSENGERSYETLEFVSHDTDKRRWLVEQLRKDAETFANKMTDTLAEIEALL